MSLLDYYGRAVGKSLDHPDNDPDDDAVACWRCHDDGMDLMSDHLLPCPDCGPDQRTTRRPTLHLKALPC